jgi:hypothetical protein
VSDHVAQRAGLDTLTARINEGYFRGLRRSAQRRLILVSTPLWIDARSAWLPAWLAWLVVLLAGGVFVQAVVYAAMEHVSHRSTQRAAGHVAEIHLEPAFGMHLSSGLLHALTLLTAVPLATTAFAARVPLDLVSPVAYAWMATVLSLACVELARGIRRRAPASD